MDIDYKKLLCALVDQIAINDYVDSLGHELKYNAAYCEAKKHVDAPERVGAALRQEVINNAT
jgi:hypothetical protein